MHQAQAEMVIYFLTFLHDPVSMSPESLQMRAGIAAGLINKAIMLEPFAAPVAASMEVLTEGLVTSGVGAEVGKAIEKGLNENFSTAQSEIQAAKSLAHRSQRLRRKQRFLLQLCGTRQELL